MTNAFYPNFLEALQDGSINTDMSGGTVKLALIDTGVYTFSAAHTFLTSLTGIIGTAQTLASKTFTDGVFDFDDPTWPSVTGNEAEAFVSYIDTGVAATSRLIHFIDTGQTGMPVTPNGGDITLAVNASGFAAL